MRTPRASSIGSKKELGIYSDTAVGYALQYWIAGRYSAASWFYPVAGNLLHHAIELLLKAAIARKGIEVPIGNSGHRLVDIVWPKFRSLYPDPALDRFVSVIADLHNFEDIRYPEALTKGGGFMTIAFERDSLSKRTGGTTSRLPEFKSVVHDVDELVRVLLAQMPFNPAFYGRNLEQEHAARYHLHNNPKPLPTK